MSRSALITGSSRGIGRAVAEALAREGWPVCVNYLEHKGAAESLVDLLRSEGRMAMAFRADVADRAAVNEMVRAASETLGPVELLVNNAGVAGQCLFQDITDALWERYLGVNLGGARNAIQAALPHMISEKRGCIVNISSIWGLRGASCETAYACTKAALIGLTRSLALELAPSNIRVNCVAPASSTRTWSRFWERRPCGTWRSRRPWAVWARRRMWHTPWPFSPRRGPPSSQARSSPPTAASLSEKWHISAFLGKH